LVHKWTSLVSTVFLLMLCITGLPLVFQDEIGEFIAPRPALPAVAPGTPVPGLDSMLAGGTAANPGQRGISLGFIADEPAVLVATGADMKIPFPQQQHHVLDLRTGLPYALAPSRDIPFLTLMLDLHTKMLMGLPGTLFLGVMGLSLVASLVS